MKLVLSDGREWSAAIPSRITLLQTLCTYRSGHMGGRRARRYAEGRGGAEGRESWCRCAREDH
jgi:hypothetical protein